MLTISFAIQFLSLLITPIAVGFWFNRRWGTSWILFLGGALAFVVSWIVTILFPPQFGLLASSITQIGALYLIYRFLLNTVNTEREALMVGIGQGGIELIILALFLSVPSFTQMSTLRDATDDELVSLVATAEDIPEEEVEATQIDEWRESIDNYWSTGWYIPLIQAIPSLVILPVQAALSVIVLRALTDSALRRLAGAMSLHFLARSLPLYASVLGGVVLWLGLSLLIGGIAFWFLNPLWPIVKKQAKVALRERVKAKKQAKSA